MMQIESLTGRGNYFEDFTKGELLRHVRSKTVTEMDNVLGTLSVMNTADAHFNEAGMKGSMFGQRVTFGGVTIATVIGLAMQDTGEQAISELGLDGIRLMSPVFHGDTLTAFTEVLEIAPAERADAGIVTFRHWGRNQRDEVVFRGDRKVLIRRRPIQESK
ncbi:MaoC family dehydratase [Bradyrhizobium sp. 14AA]